MKVLFKGTVEVTYDNYDDIFDEVFDFLDSLNDGGGGVELYFEHIEEEEESTDEWDNPTS